MVKVTTPPSSHRESLWRTLPRCLPTVQLAGRLGLLCPSSLGGRARNASGISVGVQVGAALAADVSTLRSREETLRRPDTSVKEVAEDSCDCGGTSSLRNPEILRAMAPPKLLAIM